MLRGRVEWRGEGGYGDGGGWELQGGGGRVRRVGWAGG